MTIKASKRPARRVTTGAARVLPHGIVPGALRTARGRCTALVRRSK